MSAKGVDDLELTTLKIPYDDIASFRAVLGVHDRHLDVLNALFHTSIFTRGEDILVQSDDPELVGRIETTLSLLFTLAQHKISFGERDVIYIAQMASKTEAQTLIDHYLKRQEITRTLSGKPIFAKTLAQRAYLSHIERKPLVFAIGPAGTGKTYLAVIHAVSLLKQGRIKKIILTRPAVEAGENLGFLPGDLKEKIDPYLRPLYDALYDVLGRKSVEDMLEKSIIEIAPLAYMRGRTLDDAYVILDEAQNTTIGQMKLFLTRLGFHSKMVVTGDLTQIDLPSKVESGLIHATRILKSIPEIEVIRFERYDVIRHPLIQTILERYDA